MRIFHCDHCQNLVFFENVQCGVCQHQLAFLPDLEVVGSLDVDGDLWKSPLKDAATQHYRLCRNYTNHNICNWAIPLDDPEPFCASCRLTQVIPDLSQAGSVEKWFKVEVAKRRTIYSLMRLGCPMVAQEGANACGLSSSFSLTRNKTWHQSSRGMPME